MLSLVLYNYKIVKKQKQKQEQKQMVKIIYRKIIVKTTNSRHFSQSKKSNLSKQTLC